MMLYDSFAVLHLNLTAIGGLLFLTATCLILAYKLATQAPATALPHASSSSNTTPLASLLQVYSGMLLPWLLVLSSTRGGDMIVLVSWCVSLRPLVLTQILVCTLMLLLSVSFSIFSNFNLSVRWAWEFLSCVLSLQICWTAMGCGPSALSALLWLEVASLCALLLLTFVTASHVSRASTFLSWRSFYVSRQAQLSFLSAMLAFLWAGGFAAILLLLVLSFGVGSGLSLNYAELLLNAAQAKAEVSRPGFLLSLSAAGLLVKLLLQPFQFFLLSFYKRLTMSALSVYLVFYYIFLVPSILALFGPVLACFIPSWLLAFIALGLASLSLLGGGLASAVDLRVTLAYSTVVNLSLLLVALTIWA